MTAGARDRACKGALAGRCGYSGSVKETGGSLDEMGLS